MIIKSAQVQTVDRHFIAVNNAEIIRDGLFCDFEGSRLFMPFNSIFAVVYDKKNVEGYKEKHSEKS